MKLFQTIKSFLYERKGHCQSMFCSECDYYSFDDEKPCSWLNQFENKQRKAEDMEIKSLETIQRIDDVLNVEGMTEIDVLDEMMDAVSEFKYDCGVSE